MEQLSVSNTYVHIEVSSGKVECTYDVGKIKKIEVQTLNYDSNLSYVQVIMNDGTYSWETDKIYLVGYMMYGVPVSQDGCYVFAQQDMNGLYCLDAKTGRIIWKTKSKAEISNVLVCPKHLCCSKSRDEIQLIDINTGEVIKSYKTPFDNRFEVINDNYILNHTRSKLWEILSSQTLEVEQSFADNEFSIKHRFLNNFVNKK